MSLQKNVYDLCIVGGGYSGLVLAIECARAGLLVCLLERNSLLGKKILSTGNGRCNFTNSDMSKSHFYSNSPIDFTIDYKDTISFMKSIGVISKDINGYYYPITNQAQTVQEALINTIELLDISVFLNTQVKKIEAGEIIKLIDTNKNEFFCKNVAVATGGYAAPKLGSNGDGYYLAKQLSVKCLPCFPGLVGLKSSEAFLKYLAGVRATANVVYKDSEFSGEVQFNKDGISGYPVMCLSRNIAQNINQDNIIKLDLVPYISPDDLIAEISNRFIKFKNQPVKKSLIGLINDNLIDACLNRLNISLDDKCCTLDNKKINKISSILKEFNIKIDDTKGFDYAQVTAGGVDLNEIDLKTMHLKKQYLKNIYFIGEVLDIDGICGGYNLEWARYSAHLAAKSIINN